MKRRITFGSLGITLVLVLAIGTFLGVSRTSAQLCLPDPCPTGQPYQTPMVWGFGADCDEALQDATVQAFSHASDGCGRATLVCNFEFVPTASCFFNSQKGMYQQDGYGVYNCTTCGGY